jgi:hypothetical protein
MLCARSVQAGWRRYNRALFRKEAKTVNAHEKTEEIGEKARKGDSSEGQSGVFCAEEGGTSAA